MWPLDQLPPGHVAVPTFRSAPAWKISLDWRVSEQRRASGAISCVLGAYFITGTLYCARRSKHLYRRREYSFADSRGSTDGGPFTAGMMMDPRDSVGIRCGGSLNDSTCFCRAIGHFCWNERLTGERYGTEA